MVVIGEMHKIDEETFQWKIILKDFFLAMAKNKFGKSSPFLFVEGCWYLGLQQHIGILPISNDLIEVYLMKDSHFNVSVDFSIDFQIKDMKIYPERCATIDYHQSGAGFSIKESELIQKCQLLSSDTFSVICRIKKQRSITAIFPLFHQNPSKLVMVLKETLVAVEKEDNRKAQDDISEYLAVIETMLYNSNDKESNPNIVTQLIEEMHSCNMLFLLVNSLSMLDFEIKNSVVQVFSSILRRQIGQTLPTVEYICAMPDILFALIRGYGKQDIALTCGTMLRECIDYESLSKLILYSEEFYYFFHYIEALAFDVASDAFSTFKELLTAHKILCSEFLERNYDRFFSHFQHLLNSDNTVTKRQSLKLLAELLLDGHNVTIMIRYMTTHENLKLTKEMLKAADPKLHLKAFYVLKDLVTNPNKLKDRLYILVKYKNELVKLLSNMECSDELFNDDKIYLIKQIKELHD